jgi:GcrA cell cycle regulator
MALPEEQRCTLLELTSETCRFPLWGSDEREGFYCGAKPVPGLPYCLGHCRMAYVPVRTREQRKAA